MNVLTLTIPLDNKGALIRGSDMLHGLAKDLDSKTPPSTNDTSPEIAGDTSPEITNTVNTEGDKTPIVDKDGLRWDSRIHVASKAVLKSGIFRLQGKATPELIAQVKQEQNQMSAGVSETATGGFEIGAGGEVEQIENNSIANQAFGGNNEQKPHVTTTPISFAELMKKTTARQLEKPDFAQTVQAVLADNKIPSLSALIPMVELIPVVDASLDQLWLTA